MKKVLGLVHNREEEIEAHKIIMQKVKLIFEKKSALWNLIAFLSQIMKYFPLNTDHRKMVLSLLESIPKEDTLRIRTYKDKLRTASKNEYISPCIQETDEVPISTPEKEETNDEVKTENTEENTSEAPQNEESNNETAQSEEKANESEQSDKKETESNAESEDAKSQSQKENEETQQNTEQKKAEEKAQSESKKVQSAPDKRLNDRDRRQHSDQRQQGRYASPRYPSRSGYSTRREDDRQRARREEVDPRYGYDRDPDYDRYYGHDRYYSDYRGNRR